MADGTIHSAVAPGGARWGLDADEAPPPARRFTTVPAETTRLGSPALSIPDRRVGGGPFYPGKRTTDLERGRFSPLATLG